MEVGDPVNRRVNPPFPPPVKGGYYVKDIPKKSKKKGNLTTVIYDVSDFLNRIYEDNIRMAEQLGFYRAKYGVQSTIEGEVIEVINEKVMSE